MSVQMDAEKTTANSATKIAHDNHTDFSTARSWLEGLSAEECAAALSFQDGKFLTSFLELTTTAASSATTKQSNAVDTNLWTMSVDEKAWEEKLSSHPREELGGGNNLEAGSEEATVEYDKTAGEEQEMPPELEKPVEREDQNATTTTLTTITTTTTASILGTTNLGDDSAGGTKEEADDFRIGGESTDANNTPVVDTNSNLNDPQDENTPSGDVDGAKPDAIQQGDTFVETAVKEISDNICVVHPSATGAVGMPFVTIHPNYLKSKGTGEVLQCLDIMVQKLSSSSGFLPPDFLPKEYLDGGGHGSVENMCLQRLQSLMTTASDNHASVMVFLILLVRIEVAAYMAFTARTQEEEQSTIKDTTARLSKEQLESLMKQIDVLEKKSQTLDESSLKAVVMPLTEAGYCSLSGKEMESHAVQVQNLIFTPLPALLRLFSSVEANDSPAFQRWNKAWAATIGNLLEISESSSDTATTNNTTTAPSVEQISDIITTTATPQKPSTPITTPPPNTNANITPSKPVASNKEATASNLNRSVPLPAQGEAPEGIHNDTPSATASTSSSSTKKKRKKRNKKKNKQKNAPGNNDDSTAEMPHPKGHHPKPSNHVVENNQKQAAAAGSSGQNQNGKSVKTEAAVGKSPGNESGNKTVTEKAVEKPVAAIVNKETQGAAANAAVTEKTDSEIQASRSEDTTATKTEQTKPGDNLTPSGKAGNDADVAVSRVHGVGTVVVAPSASDGEKHKPTSTPAERPAAASAKGESAPADESHDEWETVEVKGRGNRKKSGRGHSQQGGSNGGNSNQNGSKKSKSARTSASRKRLANRKMVKDILSSVLDTVDDEVWKRQQQQEARPAKNGVTTPTCNASPSPAPTQPAWKDGSRTPGITDGKKKESTTRDFVVGKKVTNAAKRTPQQAPKVDAKGNIKSPSAQSSASARTNQRNGASSPLKGSKAHTAGADQNTAPTIPETVSAVSEPKRTVPRSDRDIARSDSSSAETDDNHKQEELVSAQANADKSRSPEPPLPTLLNPGNVNSASSSVASSLEAPHASHGHHHSSTSNEVDVGYHLLDVCDRLTRDMHIFMARRASALSIRRRERGALLGALQDSVSSIWGIHSHVELYGSCATMLDLPSSDLDVVVCGLEQIEVTMSAASSPQKGMSPGKMSPESQLRHSMPHFIPMQLNAERVVRLAAELERHPWAVHVKAIPTASVPVVKVLADPSRLPGTVPLSVLEGEEWMMQQHHVVNQTTAGVAPPASDGSNADASHANTPHYQSGMSPVWRGADVMNGLLQVDITFEGPEHGGIGSTEFSARVVQNVCEETGLVAESTAFVQVIMVVKELLAQRRLNEPFSGGLSSYALLLLVLAVMCERKVIRAELDRVERQRRLVAAGGGNSEMSGQADSQPPQQVGNPAAQDVTGTSHVANKPKTTGNKNDNKKAASNGSEIQGTKHGTKGAAQPEKRNQGNQQKGGNAGGNQTRGGNAGGNVQQRGKNAGGNQQKPGGNHQKGGNQNKANQQDTTKGGAARALEKKPAKGAGNSWASVAMGKQEAAGSKESPGGKKQEQQKKKSSQPTKPSSFADAVARNAAGAGKGNTPTAKASPGGAAAKVANTPVSKGQEGGANKKTVSQEQRGAPVKVEEKAKGGQEKAGKKGAENAPASKKSQNASSEKLANAEKETNRERKIEADEKTSKFNNYSSEPVEPALSTTQSAFPQGFNDVIEVLCSGETTPGKLLMHFLLFYGQHFDAHATAIDISGKHHRDISIPTYPHLSPYIQRRSAGTIDPITGMLTVDPIVVYDPLEGAENNNVARRCFLWSSVKWVFAQSYMTLSSAAERNTTPPGTPSGTGVKNAATNAQNSESKQKQGADAVDSTAWNGPYNPTDKGSLFDPSSPLLELLLSF